ncbi:MAG: sigma-70 family RNA polymerase sigma factor [Elusimicrobiota bacterium]
MKKHCESKKRFGKEGTATAARNEILESFMRDSGSKAYAFAHGLVGNRDDASELVQETLYRVARAWDRYEESKPLEAWFFVVLRNAFIDSTRRVERKRGVSLDRPLDGEDGSTLAELLPDQSESIQARLEREESAKTVRRALRGKRKNLRAALTLCDMKGERYDAIARSLGVSMGTVRSRIFRARQALRNQSPELATLAY